MATALAPELFDQVEEALKDVTDPELGVNIVDLGLVYKCETEPVEGGEKVKVEFTLTAPGCGMGEVLADEICDKVLTLPHVGEATVELVFDPPWDSSRMSDEAKLQLNMF